MATRKPANTSKSAKKALVSKQAVRKPVSESATATGAVRQSGPGKSVKKTAAKKVAGAASAERKPASKSSTKKSAAKQPIAKKSVAKKSAVKTALVKKPVAKKVAAKEAAAKTTKAKQIEKKTSKVTAPAGKALPKPALPRPAAAATRLQPRSTAAKTASKEVSAAQGPGRTKGVASKAKAARKTTPDQALAVTRQLLEQKQAHDRELQPWQLLDTHQNHVPEPGFQSNEAAEAAVELHAGESRMKAIQGSAGTQDRRNQGKRDNR